MDENTKIVLKLILVGSFGTGKTSLRRHYMGQRMKRKYTATVGADFSLKLIELDNIAYQLLIWDIAGEAKFETVRDVYYQGAHGVILVFDLARRESFDDLSQWVKEIEKSTKTEGIPVILLGNKKDLAPLEMNQCATNKEIQDFVEGLNEKYEGDFIVEYLETSVLTGLNIESAFTKLVNKINDWLPIRARKLQGY